MARRATKAELARRIDDVFPLVVNCMRPREIRRIVDAKTDWGPTVSDRTLRRYIALAWERVRAAVADLDYGREFGAMKSRIEREIARGFINNDVKAWLMANKLLLALLDLSAANHAGKEDDDQEALAAQARAEIAGQLARLAEPKAARRGSRPPKRRPDPGSAG